MEIGERRNGNIENLKDFFVPQEDGDDDQYEDSYQRRSSSSERESRDGRDYENSRSYRAERFDDIEEKEIRL